MSTDWRNLRTPAYYLNNSSCVILFIGNNSLLYVLWFSICIYYRLILVISSNGIWLEKFCPIKQLNKSDYDKIHDRNLSCNGPKNLLLNPHFPIKSRITIEYYSSKLNIMLDFEADSHKNIFKQRKKLNYQSSMAFHIYYCYIWSRIAK